ncbi:HisA/HisF-related TIM barrel protein, partial [[Eubacterium] siraeum]|nr:HisA/HisF-related TIM barrel protein [[Eubacterium] siraeum]
FLDITATHEGRGTMVDVVRRTAQRVFVPLMVGGGISSVDDFRELLRSGADKVSVNSAAVRNPQLIHDAAVYNYRPAVALFLCVNCHYHALTAEYLGGIV